MVSYEKLLEKVLRAAEMLPDEERRAFHYFSNTNEIHGNAVITSQTLAEIANDLRAAIAEPAEKAAGRDVQHEPAIDAVRVVRCKDCGNFRQNAYGVCWCEEYGGAITPEDYCSRAVTDKPSQVKIP